MRSLIFSAFTLAMMVPSFSYACSSTCPAGTTLTCSGTGSCTCPGTSCGQNGTCNCTTSTGLAFEIIGKGNSPRVINPDEVFICKDGMEPVYYQNLQAYVCPVKPVPGPAAPARK